ncbi:lipase family protein [Nocardia sp. CDC159]|uniref:Lipase family protein n=1 Tax=Nocardia pulmonis TaxID=2951408 RepID=A0A9X2EDN7_9NOCA|nr:MULTISPECIES: lipase family protein [Nocardia]MCM6778431.1 lipase family protein [Nocardia pulmonis]MCM6791320.1 lipase family protein [Nocardia sp. CDC159]
MEVRGVVLSAAIAAALLVTAASAVSASADPGAAAPGSVIAVGALTDGGHPAGAAVERRITYWSTGPQDQPVRTTGRVFLPAGSPPPGGWPIISWHHGTVGLAATCAPSTSNSDSGDEDFLSWWLTHGYAVVATDYAFYGDPGVAAYLDGHSEAHNAIDIVRAARAAEPSLSNSWLAAGHSQGGHAVLFTAALAPVYAPELDYRGAIALAPANHLTEQFAVLGNPATPTPPELLPQADMLAKILRGLSVARPEFDPGPYLTPHGAQYVADNGRLCPAELFQKYHGITFAQLLAAPVATGDFPATAAPVLDIPLTGYQRPVFIGQGLADTLVQPNLTDATVAQLRVNNQPVTYRTYPATHLTIPTAAAADALGFADSQLGR